MRRPRASCGTSDGSIAVRSMLDKAFARTVVMCCAALFRVRLVSAPSARAPTHGERQSSGMVPSFARLASPVGSSRSMMSSCARGSQPSWAILVSLSPRHPISGAPLMRGSRVWPPVAGLSSFSRLLLDPMSGLIGMPGFFFMSFSASALTADSCPSESSVMTRLGGLTCRRSRRSPPSGRPRLSVGSVGRMTD